MQKKNIFEEGSFTPPAPGPHSKRWRNISGSISELLAFILQHKIKRFTWPCSIFKTNLFIYLFILHPKNRFPCFLFSQFTPLSPLCSHLPIHLHLHFCLGRAGVPWVSTKHGISSCSKTNVGMLTNSRVHLLIHLTDYFKFLLFARHSLCNPLMNK